MDNKKKLIASTCAAFIVSVPLLISVPTTAVAGSCSTYGNSVYCSDGSSYQTYGNSTYGNDGYSSQTYGNSTYGNDGSSYQSYGNTIYGDW
jgi:hypothetical protein